MAKAINPNLDQSARVYAGRPSFGFFRVGDNIKQDSVHSAVAFCPWLKEPALVTKVEADQLYAIGLNSGIEAATEDPNHLLLLSRSGLRFSVGDRVVHLSDKLIPDIEAAICGTVIAISPEVRDAQFPYIVEFDEEVKGHAAKNFWACSWYPEKYKTPSSKRYICSENDLVEIDKAKSEVKLLADKPKEANVMQWLKDIIIKRKAGIAHMFILYGNIGDLQRNLSGKYLTLHQYLDEVFNQRLVVYYSLSTGLRFSNPNSETVFRTLYKKIRPGTQQQSQGSTAMAQAMAGFQRSMDSMPIDELIGKTPDKVFPVLEAMLHYHDSQERQGNAVKMSLIIDFANNIAPSNSAAGAGSSAPDRINVETLEIWARSTQIRELDHTIILLSQHLTDIAPSLRGSSSQAAPVRIPKPDDEQRTKYWQDCINRNGVQLADGLDANQLGRMTSGLSLLQISNIYAMARVEGVPLGMSLIKRHKQEVLNAEFGDRVKVKVPLWGFDYFGGKENVKQYLLEVRDNILAGRLRRVPMGILGNGPPGTGKTFMFECWAFECGFNFVEITNPRSMWVGQSEEMMDNILDALDDLAPVIVVEDEADQSETPRDVPNGDSGVSSRLRQKKFMFCSDPKRRGRVIWVRITNRHDLIDEAYKRKGRSDDNIPFILPDVAEYAEIFRVMFARYGIPTDLADFAPFAEKVADKVYCTGADVEWIVLEADKYAGRAGQESVSEGFLLQAIDDWEMDLNPSVIDHQTILAIQGSSKRLRPSNWQQILAGAQKRLGMGSMSSAVMPDLSSGGSESATVQS